MIDMPDISFSEPLYVALAGLGVACLSAMAPLVNLILTSRTRSREKKEDWRRQDQVAEQAARAAKLLLESQTKMFQRQAEVADQAAKAAKLLLAAQAETTSQNAETQGKLNQIHTLVNSNLTKEMQDRLIAINAQVFLTKEVMRLNRLNKLEPDAGAVASLKKLEEASANLSSTLTERLTATAVANTEILEK